MADLFIDADSVILERGIRLLPRMGTAQSVHDLSLSVSKLLDTDEAQTKWSLAFSERLEELSRGN
jgi:hypothetical protein